MKPEIEVFKSYETAEFSCENEIKKPEMNIMLFSSQEWFDYNFVFIQSIMENNSHVTVHLFIVSFIEIVGKERLSKFMEEQGHRITFYVLDKKVLAPFNRKDRARGGGAGFVRVISHTFIEEKYDRILFMDSDMVILGDIYTDFYNLNFEGNALISPSIPLDYEKQNKLTWSTINMNAAIHGDYFNSGLAILNITKLKKDLPYERLINIYKETPKIENEQHLWNTALAAETKYVDPQIYHVRWNILNLHKEHLKEFKKEIRIFHYDPLSVPFKPWDVFFEDDRYKNLILEYPMKSITSTYRTVVMGEWINEMLGLWWDYAKRTPIYEDVYKKMLIVREYFLAHISRICNRVNRAQTDLEKIRYNVNTDERKHIENIKRKNKSTWLNAVKKYYSIPICEDHSKQGFYDYKDLNAYLEYFIGNKDIVIFMTASITAHFVLNNLKCKSKLGLKEELSVNDGYIAIIDFEKEIVKEQAGAKLIEYNYIVENETTSMKVESNEIIVDVQVKTKQIVYVLLKSQGYNPKTLNSFNGILMNNIDYAQTIKGMNIVVYSKAQNTVIDSCYVNTTDLVIKR